MAYLDDAAIERERIRQRMLANAPQIGIGENPMVPPGLGAYQDDALRNLQMPTAPGKVNDVPLSSGIQVAPAVARTPTPPSQWKTDNSLANALGGLGKGGGIQELLARLRAEQAKRAVPTGNVVRGQNLAPPAGTTQAAPGTPRVQAPGGAPTPQQLIPGLQPPLDAKEYPPGAPAAKAYMQEQDKQVGGVTGVEKPAGTTAAQPLASGATESEILAGQRKDYAAQLDGNPASKAKLGALMLAEEGGDSTARTALAETVFNRGNSRNIPSIEGVMDPNYYQPMSDGSGNYDKALSRIQNDPKLRAQVFSEIDRVGKGGSNVSNLATDNASGSVARNSATNQTLAFKGDNGEGFFRKDVHPEVHGAGNVAHTKDWYNNTTAAMADEKPGAATQTADASGAVPGAGAPGTPPATPQESPPPWLKDAVGTYALEKGTPPGDAFATPGAEAPAGLTADALKGSAAATNPVLNPGVPNVGHMGEAHTALNLTPQEQALYQRHLDNLTGTGGVDHPPTAQDPYPSRSSLYQINEEIGGKHYNLPTVYDGKILSRDEAVARAQAQGLDKFPSYGSADEAEKRYQDMHQYMDRDTGDYFDMKSKQPQIGSKPPASTTPTSLPPRNADLRSSLWDATSSAQPVPPQQPPQMTPNLAKAIVGAVEAKDASAIAPPSPPGAQPVQMPTDVAPPAPGAPGGPGIQGVPGGTLPAGNAPVMMQQASQGNPIAMAGLAPPPVEAAPLATPLTTQQTTFPNALQPPIPFSEMQGWGWSAPDTGSWGGWSGGGFDGGFSGGE